MRKLWKEVAAALRRDVEQAPKRVGEITRAMVLAGRRFREAHLAAPEMADLAALPTKHVIDRLVPVLAVRQTVLFTHQLSEFRGIAEIICVVAIPRSGKE